MYVILEIYVCLRVACTFVFPDSITDITTRNLERNSYGFLVILVA